MCDISWLETYKCTADSTATDTVAVPGCAVLCCADGRSCHAAAYQAETCCVCMCCSRNLDNIPAADDAPLSRVGGTRGLLWVCLLCVSFRWGAHCRLQPTLRCERNAGFVEVCCTACCCVQCIPVSPHAPAVAVGG